MNRIINLIQAMPIPQRFRTALLCRSGLRIGKEVVIGGGIFFGSGKCEIGDGTFISVNCFFDGSDWIHIGKNVSIASGVQIITGSHAIGDKNKRAGTQRNRPVSIGDGCWLGAACVILPGVSIAPGCVIGAGAIVTKSTRENALYVGSPARKIRDLGADAPNALALSAYDAVRAD
jgi:maltose O-acetyltransferase